MVESGLDHIRILQDNDFHEFKISVKASDVFLAAAAYQGIAEATDAPIHLGITEAGGLMSGTIKSAIGLGNLLWMGIGDTIRVSLSADPVEEVRVGYEILKSLGLRHRGVNIISCPSCARQGFDVIRTVESAGEAARARQDADEPLDHRLRRERPGRGADDRRRLHRRRRGRRHGLSRRQAEPPDVERPDDRPHRGAGRDAAPPRSRPRPPPPTRPPNDAWRPRPPPQPPSVWSCTLNHASASSRCCGRKAGQYSSMT